MKYLVASAAAVGLLADGALAQDRVELAPFSNWVMNYDDDSCALQRQFGEEGDQVYLELRQFGRGRDMQVVIASKDFRPRRGEFKLAFEPIDQEPRDIVGFDLALPDDYEGKLFSITPGADDPRIDAAWREFAEVTPILTEGQRKVVLQAIGLDWDSRTLQRLALDQDYVSGSRLAAEAFHVSPTWHELRDKIEAEVDGVSIRGAFNKPLYLRTGELHEPMEAMRTCLEDLYKNWGIDVEAHRNLTRPAIPLDYAKLVREFQESYPGGMAARGMQGYLRVRLNISAEGEPTSCHMQSPINNDETFERVACNNMMRYANFAPALDSQGRAIASVYQTAIVYQIAR